MATTAVWRTSAVCRATSARWWWPVSPISSWTRRHESLPWGDRDFVRLDHAAEMLDLFPDCRLAVLPATRHTEVMQRTDELRALIGPFLSQRPAAS